MKRGYRWTFAFVCVSGLTVVCALEGATDGKSVPSTRSMVDTTARFAQVDKPSQSVASRVHAKSPAFVPGQVVVGFRNGVGDEEISSVMNKFGLSLHRQNKRLRVDAFSIPTTADVSSVIQKLKAQPEVAFAEPNYVVQSLSTGFSPSDTYYTSTYLTSQDGDVSQWALQAMGAPLAWQYFRGPGTVTVAELDTGIDATHPDLSANILPGGYNFVANDTNTNDDDGHGTHVAGIIGAVTNNSEGIASVSFNTAKLLPIKVLDQTGSGTSAAVAEGITYAVDHGAQIINMSLGTTDDSEAIQSAVNYAWDHGVLVIAAAGNSGNTTPEYPAADNHVLAVTATDSTGAPASFDTVGNEVSVAAPGVNILSTMPTSPVFLTQVFGYEENYDALSGTSMAAPEVSALAALIMAQNPTFTPSQVIQRIEQSATSPTGEWTSNEGWGVVNAGYAITDTLNHDQFGGIVGQVTDTNGLPLVGVSVMAGGQTVTTSANGTYRIQNLPVSGSPYTVQVQSGSNTVSKSVSLVPGADDSVDFSMGMGTYSAFIQNGGFETGDLTGWDIIGNEPTPVVTSDLANSGTYSVRLGASSGAEPQGDSGISQTITVNIPPGDTHATLTFATRRATTDVAPYDSQEVRIQSIEGKTLKQVFEETSNSEKWETTSVDLTAFNQQTISIQFLVHEDGAGDPTWMNVDDVTVTYS